MMHAQCRQAYVHILVTTFSPLMYLQKPYKISPILCRKFSGKQHGKEALIKSYYHQIKNEDLSPDSLMPYRFFKQTLKCE